MATCKPCRRVFSSERALGQHLHDAPRHEFDCRLCRRHFKTEPAQAQHFRDSPKHNVCIHCGPEKDFDTCDELHLKAHKTKTVECFGRDRKFVSTSAMVLHLERNTCESGFNCEEMIDAARFSDNLGANFDLNPDYPFKCLCCDNEIRFFSGLLQHIESDKCEEVLEDGGALHRFLAELEEDVRLGC